MEDNGLSDTQFTIDVPLFGEVLVQFNPKYELKNYEIGVAFSQIENKNLGTIFPFDYKQFLRVHMSCEKLTNWKENKQITPFKTIVGFIQNVFEEMEDQIDPSQNAMKIIRGCQRPDPCLSCFIVTRLLCCIK